MRFAFLDDVRLKKIVNFGFLKGTCEGGGVLRIGVRPLGECVAAYLDLGTGRISPLLC